MTRAQQITAYIAEAQGDWSPEKDAARAERKAERKEKNRMKNQVSQARRLAALDSTRDRHHGHARPMTPYAQERYRRMTQE